MSVTRPSRLAGSVIGTVLCVVLAAGCAQPTAGRPVADRDAAEQASADAVQRGLDAFQNHFVELGDEHARVYNYLNFGDLKIATEHETYKVGDPPSIFYKRRFEEQGDWSETIWPSESEVDYIRLDSDHAFLAPTPWVSVPSLYKDGFENCFLITAWVACHLDKAIGQTKLDAPDEQPNSATTSDEGFEVTTGAQLKIMIDEGFISIPEERRDGLTDPMLETVVPVLLQFDDDMSFTGFEIRDSITDGDAKLELQIEYEVIGEAKEDDVPDPPAGSQVTAITDQAAVDAFWDKFNDRTPQS